MAVITRTQVIHKPVDEVFDVLADLGSWAEWNPTIRSSRWLDDPPHGNGARFECGLRGLGMVGQELVAFQPRVQLRVVTDLKPVKGGAPPPPHRQRRCHSHRSRARDNPEGYFQAVRANAGNERTQKPSRHRKRNRDPFRVVARFGKRRRHALEVALVERVIELADDRLRLHLRWKRSTPTGTSMRGLRDGGSIEEDQVANGAGLTVRRASPDRWVRRPTPSEALPPCRDTRARAPPRCGRADARAPSSADTRLAASPSHLRRALCSERRAPGECARARP